MKQFFGDWFGMIVTAAITIGLIVGVVAMFADAAATNGAGY